MPGVTFAAFTTGTPAVSDFLVGYATAVLGGERRQTIADVLDLYNDRTATLTNKTIAGGSNTITGISLTTAVTGTLPVANGGTGATSLTSTALLLGAGTSPVSASDLTYSTPTLTVPASFAITGAGSLAFNAGGTNQNITLTPSGTGGVTVSGPAIINRNSVTPATAKSGSEIGIGVIGADSTQTNIFIQGYGGGNPMFQAYMVGGTAASPSAVTSGQRLVRFAGGGYDGSALVDAKAEIRALSSENWVSGSNLGTDLIFYNTNSGGTSTSEKMRLGPDGALRFPSTNTSGLQLYNTADQTTNYERLEASWGSNEAFIRTTAGGSGSTRKLNLSSATASGSYIRLILDRSGSGPWATFSNGGTSTAGTLVSMGTSGAQTATSGTVVTLAITPTYNQASGTAANTDFLINRTQTAVGSGTQRLIDAQVGGVSQFSVSNTGVVALGNTVAAAVAVASTHKVTMVIGGVTYYLLATNVP